MEKIKAEYSKKIQHPEKSFFSPVSAWKYLLKKPVTVRVPKEKRPASPRYRGFHVNDIEKCIGCGTCASICPTEAIKMIEVDREKKNGEFNRRPAVDYGRCSFCGLCVDICTTGSLGMTGEYNYIDKNADTFFFIPTKEGIHKEKFPDGYTRDETSDLLELKRIKMKEEGAKIRVKSFLEIVKGYSLEEAKREASRCVDCSICRDVCPANMHIPQYIKGIWKEDLEQSVKQIYKTNPLPSVCGRVCTHKCEEACSIGNRGEPVAIRWLKRYAMDNIPQDYLDRFIDSFKAVKKTGKKVAIVGAGPAGLSAAYFLKPLGYEVTIFEKNPLPGGVMRYGIPPYRLPDKDLEKDIKLIEAIGVEIKCGVNIGKDLSLEQLDKFYKYDAVLLAIGFSDPRLTGVKGSDSKSVVQAVDFLTNSSNWVREPKKPVPFVPPLLIVVGGGNVAFDVARSAARIQKFSYGKVDIKLISLETRDIMPADLEEIEEGAEEGIKIFNGWGPKEVLFSEEGKLIGLRAVKCISVFDEKKRFNPKYDETIIEDFKAEGIVEAIGQQPDYSLIPDNLKENVEIIRGRVFADELGKTGIDWLFVAGDILHGPDIIHAVSDGEKAARGIDSYIRSKTGKE